MSLSRQAMQELLHGLTPTGTATVALLQINLNLRVVHRRHLIVALATDSASHYNSIARSRDEGTVMPTVPGIPGPFRFFFYSFDCHEPKHVHVRRDRKVCKFWVEPIVLSSNNGFTSKELNRIRAIIRDNLLDILEAWNEHCGE
jgi:hypothetical protein